MNGENDAQHSGHCDQSQRGPSSREQTLHEEEEERDDLEDEQADKVDIDLGRNKGARRVDVADVHVDEVVAIREPSQRKVGKTER